MRVIADTHVFLWFVHGDQQLATRYRSMIEDVDNQVLLSIASLWEIAIKSSLKKKLGLQRPFKELVEREIARNRFELVGIESEHLIELEQLPHHHGDPFDRLIIAQSIVEKLPILTIDPKFALYPISVV
jgi:PIN domain nuclease of toxin-antitoxin system